MKQEMWRKKLEYFWMYYKIPFLAAACVIIVVSYFVYAKATEREHALDAILLDVRSDVQQDDLEEAFAGYAGIDTEKYEVSVSTDLLFSDASSGSYAMTSLARFYTQIGTGELDVCVMLEEDFSQYAQADSFLDLRQVFSEEELAGFPELYADSDGNAVGIYAEDLKIIDEIDGYDNPDTHAVAGILYNTERQDTAKQFLEFLLEGEL